MNRLQPLDPAVGQVWRGVGHGSLFRVLLVDNGEVVFLVMYNGNPQNADAFPEGQVRRMPLDVWLNGGLEYAWTIGV